MLRSVRHPLTVLLAAVATLAASTLAYGDGVDVSHWQGTVNWRKVAADDITFAFMKATEGTTYADPTLRTNWTGAEKVGIYRAAYHFARPSTAAGSAAAQARFFVATAGTFGDAGDLPPVLDLEATGGLGTAALRSWVSTWLRTVERLTGRTPILYFSPSFWVDHLGNSTAFHHYPLWIANYTTGSPTVPGGWPTWTFWQRTSSGHVSGIGGLVDLNRFNGSSAQLAKIANASGGSGDPAPTGPTLPVGAATTLSVMPSSTAVPIGRVVRFTGQLTTTTPVAAVAGQRVSLWARPRGGGWQRVSAGVTDSAGDYRLTGRVQRTTAYRARSAASSTFAPAVSAPVRVTTPPRVRLRLDLRRSGGHRAVARGSRLVLSGHLRDASGGVAGRRVRYYRRTPSSSHWVLVGGDRTAGPSGRHSLVIHPKHTRIWKAVFAGGTRFVPVRSAYLRVRVR